MVQSNSEMYMRRAFILSCVSLTRRSNMSGTPSPVTADVGTSEMFRPRFLFSSKISALRPCSANASLVLATLSSNSLMTDRFWLASVSLKPPFLVGCQSYILSICRGQSGSWMELERRYLVQGNDEGRLSLLQQVQRLDGLRLESVLFLSANLKRLW